MKRLLFTSLLLLILASTVSAQTNRVMLRLRLNDRGLISANIDGRIYDKGTTSLTFDNLRPGVHRITVYGVGVYGARPVRLYTGTLRFDPGTMNLAVVDVDRRSLRLRTRTMDEDNSYGGAGGYGPGSNDESWDGRGYNRNDGGQDDVYGNRGSGRNNGGSDDVYGDRSRSGNDNSNAGSNSGSEDRDEGYGSFPHGRDGNYNANHGNGYTGGSVFSQRDMNDLQSRVKGRIRDTDKEQIMKNVLQSRTAATEQIRSMLSWLSFDSTKLDFAKWAYSRTTDPRNYWKLEDVFSFSSSKEEFSKSISGH